MKKLLFSLLMLSTLNGFSQFVRDYDGNGNSNFGGAVGDGKFRITETIDSIAFTFTKGPGLFDSLLVFYLDAQAGGIGTTSGLAGSSTDPYLAAVSGNNPATGSSVLNFPADFQPDGAIVFDKNGGKVYYFLSNPFLGTLVIEGSAFEIEPAGSNNSPEYSQRLAKASLGLSGELNFKFLGTYIGKSASRSNEAFGDPFNNYARNADVNSYSPYTVVSYYTFNHQILPVKLTGFKALKMGRKIALNWSAAGENNIQGYTIQRSANGINFTTIGQVKARNTALSSTYQFTDASAINGVNYYRLAINGNDKTELSNIVSASIEGKPNAFTTTMLSAKTLHISLNGLTGDYRLAIVNNMGQVFYSQQLKTNGSYQNIMVSLKQTLPKGIYTVALVGAGIKMHSNILIQ